MNKINFEIKPIYHFWFWSVYFVLNTLRWGAYFNDYEYSFQSNLIEFALHIPLVYFNLFVLVPKFVLKPHYLKFGLALLASLFLIYLLKTGLTYFLISENIWPEANREYRPFDVNHIVAVCIGELYVLSMASSVYFTLTWLRERERNRALTESQFKIKLKYLKTKNILLDTACGKQIMVGQQRKSNHSVRHSSKTFYLYYVFYIAVRTLMIDRGRGGGGSKWMSPDQKCRRNTKMSEYDQKYPAPLGGITSVMWF